MASISQCRMVMAEEEKDYFKLLGDRVAQLRKAQGLTQVQLAEVLDMRRAER